MAGGAKQQASATALVVGEIEINICQKIFRSLDFFVSFFGQEKNENRL